MGVFYNAERILEDADAESVADYIGIEMSRSGSVVRIKCPGHFKNLGREDSNFGSCVLTEKGYYCYACRKAQSLIGMVQEVMNVEYQDALGIIADANGGREAYIETGKVEYEKPVKILSVEDLMLIGLNQTIYYDMLLFPETNKNYVKNCHFNIAHDKNNPDATYILASKNQTISIRALRLANEKLYNTLIKNKANEAMHKYQKCINDICSKAGSKKMLLNAFMDGKNESEILYDFKTKFEKMFRRAKEIFDEIDDIDCIIDLLDIKDVEEIPQYDLFF